MKTLLMLLLASAPLYAQVLDIPDLKDTQSNTRSVNDNFTTLDINKLDIVDLQNKVTAGSGITIVIGDTGGLTIYLTSYISDWETSTGYVTTKTDITEDYLWELSSGYLTTKTADTLDGLWEMSGGYIRLKS